MRYLVFAIFSASVLTRSVSQSPPTDVHCAKPENVVVTHVPRARTTCAWKHGGQKPLDFRLEATSSSGPPTVQEGIIGNSTVVDLQCFRNYGIIIYARYLRPDGTEFLTPSKKIPFSSGECAPPEIVWYDHKASATSVVLEWGLASMVYLNNTTGYNLTLEQDGDEQGTLNVITSSVLTHRVDKLSPETTYVARLFPFYKAKNGDILKPRETIFKFRTQSLLSSTEGLES